MVRLVVIYCISLIMILFLQALIGHDCIGLQCLHLFYIIPPEIILIILSLVFNYKFISSDNGLTYGVTGNILGLIVGPLLEIGVSIIGGISFILHYLTGIFLVINLICGMLLLWRLLKYKNRETRIFKDKNS